MKTLKNIVLLMPMLLGAHLNAGDISDKVLNATRTVENICNGPLGQKLSQQNQNRCFKAIDVGKDISGIIGNVENFKNKNLAVVQKKGDELNALLNCMGSIGSTSCKARKCASENDCIAMIFKTTSELLQPVVADLIASKISSDGKVQTAYVNGALLRLASLRIIPKSVEPKFAAFRGNIVKFAENIDGAIAFLDALALIISPSAYLESIPQPTPEQKTAALEIIPVELPKDEIINPNEGLNEPIEEVF